MREGNARGFGWAGIKTIQGLEVEGQPFQKTILRTLYF